MSAAPRILVIIHDVDGNLNELAVPFAQAGLRIESWDVVNDAASAPTLDDLESFAGIVSLGANAGVPDEAQHEWMSLERALLARALEIELPVLGLCFGSQLLASVAGGTFRPSPVREVGWTRVTMAPDAASDPVFSSLDSEIDAFHFHYDSYTLPAEVPILGETNGIIQAFRVGNSAWGTQFHLEVGLSQQLAWLTSYRRSFEREGANIEEQISTSHALWASYRAQAYAVGAAFAAQVNAYAASAALRP